MRVTRLSPILYLGVAGSFLLGILLVALLAFNGAASADEEHINLLAIDANPAGNTATHIDTIDDCLAVAGPGVSFSVDIVVDAIPALGARGFGDNILYDPTLLKLTDVDFNYLLTSGGPAQGFLIGDNLPDTDGNYRGDYADFSSNYESGQGVIARLTFQSLANGTSNVLLDNPPPPSPLLVIDGNGQPYVVDNLEAATIAIGQTCSGKTDLQATAATVSAPASASMNSAFNVLAGGTIANNGPASPVNGNAVVTLSTPPDCTSAGGNQRTVTGLNLATGTPVTIPDQTFSVTCTSPSFHAFTSSINAVLADPSISESTLANNMASSAASTSAVLANADLQLTFNSLTSVADATPTPMAGISFHVIANLSVKNLGPDGPVAFAGSASLTIPSDCTITLDLVKPFTGQIASGATLQATTSWLVTCANYGDHTFSTNATVAPTDIHVSDAAGNNSASGSGSTTLKIGACGADPAPAGNLIQNLSPQLLLLIQSLTATGTPVPSNMQTQLNCNFHITGQDQAKTPIDECAVRVPTAAPCSLSFSLNIDMTGGSPQGKPTVMLNPVGVTFLPRAYNWAGDTSVVNGTVDGSGSFGIRTDGGLLSNGFPCQLDIGLGPTPAYEGGIQGNVPDSNSSADLINPNVWPTNLNAERALVESSFTPVPGLPPAVQLWSRTIVPLDLAPLNILTWKVTNPAFEQITGALWIVVPFPGDAVGPDAPGSIGGDPDADNPPSTPTVYCTPHYVTLNFNGTAGNATLLSCTLPGSQMAWNLVDPDALNFTGDEGPRSDVSNCGLDADGDGLSANAETYWGTNALSTDTDGDGVQDAPDNCKTIANTNQADYDGDNIGDACDPDVDGDGVNNIQDLCPQTTLHTAVDSAGCSKPQVDFDGDDFCDPGAPSTGPVPCVRTDNCPLVANPDQGDDDGDGHGNACDGCPGTPTPWNVSQPDFDCDGFTDAVENFIGTDPNVPCGMDKWPADFSNDNVSNLSDLFLIVPHLNTFDGDPGSSPRFDLSTDGSINLTDIFIAVPFLNMPCDP